MTEASERPGEWWRDMASPYGAKLADLGTMTRPKLVAAGPSGGRHRTEFGQRWPTLRNSNRCSPDGVSGRQAEVSPGVA